MGRTMKVDARWDGEAGVWIATSVDIPGLVVVAANWPSMIEEVRLVVPDLLKLEASMSGRSHES